MVHRKNIDALIRLGFAFLLFVTYIYADVITINVGGNGGILKFVPQNITANHLDVIRWVFKGGNHNVVQSDSLASCTTSLNPNPFKSDTNPPTGDFNYTVVDQNTTLYYFCSNTNHCQNGMWGAIYVGTQPPPNANVPIPSSTTNSTASSTANSTAQPTMTTSSKSDAMKLVYDFNLLTFVTLTISTLMNYSF